MTEYLLIIEWIASFFAIAGSILMALKLNRMSFILPWICWIIGPALFVILFTYNNQPGMIFGQTTAILISFFGFYQWIKKENEYNQKISKLLSYLSLIFIFFGIYKLFSTLPTFGISNLEWFGATLSVSGSILLASRSQYAQYSWVLWMIANLTMTYTSFCNEQYGVMLTQLTFVLSTIIGCYKWIFKKDQPLKSEK